MSCQTTNLQFQQDPFCPPKMPDKIEIKMISNFRLFNLFDVNFFNLKYRYALTIELSRLARLVS